MNKNGQSLLEYSLIIGCVTLALLAMQVYFKRGIQGIVKATSDDLSSPVVKYYSDFENRSVNPQFQGVEESGIFNYTEYRPTNVTRKQEIVTTELGRGQRGVVINNDNTTTTGRWVVKYKWEDMYNPENTKKKGPSDPQVEPPN
jgi:hypothetical protein